MNPSNDLEVLNLRRTDTAKAALAAWVGVRRDQLPADKMWIEHPNDLNRQAWDRVIAAIEAPLIIQLSETEVALASAREASLILKGDEAAVATYAALRKERDQARADAIQKDLQNTVLTKDIRTLSETVLVLEGAARAFLERVVHLEPLIDAWLHDAQVRDGRQWTHGDWVRERDALTAALGAFTPSPASFEAEPRLLVDPWADLGEEPCPSPGELRVINGQRMRFIGRELEGDKWEVLGPAGHDGGEGR